MKIDLIKSLLPAILCLSTQAFAFPAQVANAPASDLDLALHAIQSAKKSLLVNAYELTEPHIAQALEERIRAGVLVGILQEGQPVGGISEGARKLQSQLLSAMGTSGNSNQYFEMKTLPGGKKRRFRFDHAKYMVVDDSALLIGSENYSSTGHPASGKKGNRGWEVFLHESKIARVFTELFINDSDESHGDIANLRNLSSDGSSKGNPFCDLVPFLCSKSIESAEKIENPAPAQQTPGLLSTVDVASYETIISPDNSQDGLLDMIRSAQYTLDIEQMTFYSYWDDPKTQSPLVDALVAAAERGVKVRVLLNDQKAFADETIFGSACPMQCQKSDPKQRKNHNLDTVNLLNQVAQARGLSLSAKIADLKAMGVAIIHNKGALVDQDKALISSINWNMNSISHNRETAVLLNSPEAYAYYADLFERDWQASDTQTRQQQ